MATYYDLNEYRRTKVDGEVRIEATGKTITVNRNEIALVYQAGIGYDGGNDHNVFTVQLRGGRNIITEWASISNLNLVRVNEHLRITQEDGSRIRQYSGHGLRLVSDASILSFDEAGTCYDENGQNSQDCYRLLLIDGTSVFTDADGKSDILNF